MDNDYHEGRPIMRPRKGGGVTFLCPVGHFYTSVDRKDWAGSFLEAKAGDPNWTVKCYGAMPKAVSRRAVA